MLVNPPNSRPFTVIAIDPGTYTLGVSVLQWDCQSTTFDAVAAYTLAARDTHPAYRGFADLHGNRNARLQQQFDEFQRIVHEWGPHAVIAESPYKGRFVQTFAALTECIATIRSVVIQYNPYLQLNLIDPISAKQAAGVVVNKETRKDKEAVRRALAARTDIRWHYDLQSLDEHAVDATGVGVYYLTELV